MSVESSGKLVTWRSGLRSGCFAAALLAVALSTGFMTRAAPPPAPPSCALVTAQPSLPTSDCLSTHSPDMASFADMSWQAFRFLTWPAEMPSGSGWPQPEGVAANSGLATGGPAVFLTFKADWETFRALATPPYPWGTYSPVADVCKGNPNLQPGDLVLVSLHEFSNLAEPQDPKGVNVTNVLVAQNGRVVHYMTSFGEAEFTFITKNMLYDAASDPSLTGGGPQLQVPAPGSAVVVKSAWLELAPDLSVRGATPLNVQHAFYTRDAWIEDVGADRCRKATVGLVGMHIALKTPTRPQWIWASFEHIDNVPDGTSGPRTFHDLTGTAMKSAPPPGDVLTATTIKHFQPVRFNVDRVTPIDNDILKANDAWRPIMSGPATDAVWANYKLVTVQWPATASFPGGDLSQVQPAPPCPINPANMVNTTMETFHQTTPTCKQVDDTCMGCHYMARSVDFIWAIPIKAQSRVHLLELPNRLAAIRALREIVGTYPSESEVKQR